MNVIHTITRPSGQKGRMKSMRGALGYSYINTRRLCGVELNRRWTLLLFQHQNDAVMLNNERCVTLSSSGAAMRWRWLIAQ